MNRYLKLFPAFMLICGLFSCDEQEVFQKEQYKNVFALVSGTDNVSDWIHDLRMSESEGYISASLGGTNPSTKDIRVTLVEDLSLIDDYNVVIFDVNTPRYIQPLASSKYTIDNYVFTIPAGEVKASIPVRIRPAGLSPDSSYFIALKVDSYSAYEVNPEKDYILYRVQVRNWWSATGGTIYNQRGTTQMSGLNPIQVFGTKRVFPLTPTRVRLLAGTELNDNLDENIYNWYSMVLSIGDDNRITIQPYKSLVVTQIDGDPDFPNRVVLEDDGFKTYKTFLLSYSYEGSDGITHVMKEELRLEYKEDPEDPRFLTDLN
ncbi:MAG: DUF4361 domain-containing protein [Tannerella sp.]|nr:DUF4361 domain-containing protein [Tannerella sp.]